MLRVIQEQWKLFLCQLPGSEACGQPGYMWPGPGRHVADEKEVGTLPATRSSIEEPKDVF